MDVGKRTWVFADGDLPPHGDHEPLGHEALMVVNNTDAPAHLDLEFLFEDSEPKAGVRLTVPAKRVKCFRMDYPLGDEGFQVPFGQYAVILQSDVPVVCLYGRLDRRPDMAYYPIGGFAV
ncbi:MAG TPA: sensory rhodopsin transducer [Candidatus Limnocylindria bacterium]|nr:sensory rhodopsin transducer [Candidatus Limnocylindria bacterium]